MDDNNSTKTENGTGLVYMLIICMSAILVFEGRLGCLKCRLLTLSQPLKQQQLRQISNRITEKHI